MMNRFNLIPFDEHVFYKSSSYDLKQINSRYEIIKPFFKNFDLRIVFPQLRKDSDYIDRFDIVLIKDDYVFNISENKGKYSIRPYYNYFSLVDRYFEYKEPSPRFIGKFTDKKINEWINYSIKWIDVMLEQNETDNRNYVEVQNETEKLLKRLEPFIKYDYSKDSKLYEIGEVCSIYFKRDLKATKANNQFETRVTSYVDINKFLDIIK